MLFDAAPMLIEVGGPKPITSAVKWTRAGTSWSISSDGYTATRSNGSTSTDSEVVSGTFRTTGAAAFTMILNPGTGGSRSAIGLYPSGVALSANAYADGSITWDAGGGVRVGKTNYGGSSTSYAVGDEVGFLLNADGTNLQRIKNGVILGPDFDIAIAKQSRSPGFASQNGGTQAVLLNGAPDGFPAWG